MDFLSLASQCAPSVHPQTMAAVVSVESGFNPFAIGVVGGQLDRQPTSKAEAVMTALSLEQGGHNFSVGIAQINRHNLSKYGLNYEAAFDACRNLTASSLILRDCYDRAQKKFLKADEALKAAFSCYYSGNFVRGFKSEVNGQRSYVQKVLSAASNSSVKNVLATSSGVPVTPLRFIKAKQDVRLVPTRLATSGYVFSKAPIADQGEVDASVMVFR